jgi:hypothetical protein
MLTSRKQGPDSSTSLVRHVNIGGTLDVEMKFHASILHMRGDSVAPQPFTTDNGDVFLFNGEVFDGLEVSAVYSASESPLTLSICRLDWTRTMDRSYSSKSSERVPPTSSPPSVISKDRTPLSITRRPLIVYTLHAIHWAVVPF